LNQVNFIESPEEDTSSPGDGTGSVGDGPALRVSGISLWRAARAPV